MGRATRGSVRRAAANAQLVGDRGRSRACGSRWLCHRVSSRARQVDRERRAAISLDIDREVASAASQKPVNGVVRLKLYKGGVAVVGRMSPEDSLYDANVVTFEDDGGAYDQADASGFIRLNALRLRIGAKRGRKLLE